MKSLKIVFSVLLAAILLSSCDSDDATLANVKYQIVGMDSSITQIKYNGPESVVTVTNPVNFASGADSKTVKANFLPFEAKLQVTVFNATAADKHYVLVIYEDNVSKATYNLDVPANDTATGIATYTIYAD